MREGGGWIEKGEVKRLNWSDSVDDVFANKQNDSLRGRRANWLCREMEDDAVAVAVNHTISITWLEGC